MRKGAVIVLLFCFLCGVNSSWAGEGVSNEELLKEIQALKEAAAKQEKRIAELEQRLAQQESAPKGAQLKDMTIEDFDKHIDSHLLHRIPGYQLFDGLRMGLGATFISQATYNANADALSREGEDAADASYSVDLEFEKEFAGSGRAFLHLETGDGAGVEDELKLFANVNRDADDSDNGISVTEIWYEYYMDNMPLSWTFGKIDPTIYVDNNEYANDETTQFLGRIFRNSPTVEFPDNSPGIRLGLEPTEFMGAELVLMDADSDWEDMFDGVFLAGQVNLKPALFGKGGNYRLLGWLNDRNHIKWHDATKDKEEGYGFGVSVDQQFSDNLGAFARYGWQDPQQRLSGLDDDFSLEHSWSAGLQFSGDLWGRDEDVLAVAVGEAIPSDDYKDSGSLNAKDERHLEAYYSFKANEHLTLSPDVQIIWNPYGDDAVNGKDTIVVGGIRGQVDF
ncbi:MAG: carbohydrate porin [Candidatus Omnitrophica bacterium]|nr:carbohydrate porin [Candidatus Omnitrophota bacterium]